MWKKYLPILLICFYLILISGTVCDRASAGEISDGMVFRKNQDLYFKNGECTYCRIIMWIIKEGNDVECRKNTGAEFIDIDDIDIEKTFGKNLLNEWAESKKAIHKIQTSNKLHNVKPDKVIELRTNTRSSSVASTYNNAIRPKTQSLNDEKLTSEEVYQAALPSIVYIEVENYDGSSATGSGFFVAPHIVATNAHVIEKAISGHATLIKDGTSAIIKFIKGINYGSDLALLYLEHLDAPCLRLRNSQNIQVGNELFVLGNPLQLIGTFSSGIISSCHYDGGSRFLFTAPISSGSSGGPIIDSYGNVIGVASAIIPPQSSKGLSQNLNIAVPSNYLQHLIDNNFGLKSFEELRPELSFPNKIRFHFNHPRIGNVTNRSKVRAPKDTRVRWQLDVVASDSYLESSETFYASYAFIKDVWLKEKYDVIIKPSPSSQNKHTLTSRWLRPPNLWPNRCCFVRVYYDGSLVEFTNFEVLH